MGRALSLDVGDVRIGFAISDPMFIVANPLETLTRKGLQSDLSYIAELIKLREVTEVVCGLPKTLNNTDSIQTNKVKEFASQLQEAIGLPIHFIDERLTSVSAERVLIEGNVRRDKRKGVIDKVAAAIILQQYLAIRK